MTEGADGVELDVRLAAGDRVVVLHDEHLADGRRVADVDVAELSRLGVPTLEEALEWANARSAFVNIELKEDLAHVAGPILREARVEVLVSSFDLASVVALAGLPRALLLSAESGPATPRLPVDAVHLERSLATASRIARDRTRYKIGVWTVNDPSEAEYLARLGADWLITDTPAALLTRIARGP
jgi:glycerophosphoryl diester phosphodiesterase